MNTPNLYYVAFVTILSLLIFFVKRENKIVPIIVAMCFLPADISINLAGLDFQAVRVLAITGMLSLFFTSDVPEVRFNEIDKLFVGYISLLALAYVLVSVNMFGAFINQAGRFVDSIFLYYFLRHLIVTREDLNKIARVFIWCIIFLSPFIIFEFFYGENLFSIVGRDKISVRGGEIRAAGSFSHPILLGSFAAAVLPMIWSNYKVSRKKRALLASAFCILFVFACSSSGPIVCLISCLILLCFFKYKEHSKTIVRIGFVFILFIHFVREKSFWHFIYVRLSIKGSSTGYHRYNLVEAAIREFKNWWLAGYGDIGPDWHDKYWSWAHAAFTDVTNHYLLIGVKGGVLPMILFVVLCYKSLKILGKYAVSADAVEDQWLWWGATVMMFTHCVTFLSVAYFGQITMLLYMTFAIAAFTKGGPVNEGER